MYVLFFLPYEKREVGALLTVLFCSGILYRSSLASGYFLGIWGILKGRRECCWELGPLAYQRNKNVPGSASTPWRLGKNCKVKCVLDVECQDVC